MRLLSCDCFQSSDDFTHAELSFRLNGQGRVKEGIRLLAEVKEIGMALGYLCPNEGNLVDCPLLSEGNHTPSGKGVELQQFNIRG